MAVALREKFAASKLIFRFARADFGSRVEIAADRRYSSLSRRCTLLTTSELPDESRLELSPREEKPWNCASDTKLKLDSFSCKVREIDSIRVSTPVVTYSQ